MKRLFLILLPLSLACSEPAAPSADASSSDAGIDATAPVDAGADATVERCGNGSVEKGEFCEGDSARCASLAASFSAGEASCRRDCSGYDVSLCVLGIAVEQAEVVKPAERDPERWGAALCNDGTPFTFGIRLSRTRSSTWVFSLMGGGFCDDRGVPCSERARGLTTTLAATDRQLGAAKGFEGVLSADPENNPEFHDANQVFAQYCSSDLFSGARTERAATTGSEQGWYFSGRLSVRAMIEISIARYGLDDSSPQTRVLFSGTSAGAFGTANNADQIAELLPRTAAAGRLKLLIDAGYFPRWNDADNPPSDQDAFRAAAELWGSRFHASCEAAQEHPGDCLFGYFYYPFLVGAAPVGLGLPTLVQMSLWDTSAANYKSFGGLDDPKRQAYRELLVAELEQVEWLFAGDLPYHTLSRWDDRWRLGDPGNTFRELLIRFWQGDAPERVLYAPAP